MQDFEKTSLVQEDREKTFSHHGQNGTHKYNNQDHAMMTAMLCVENIIAERKMHDDWQVDQDAEYHESDSAGQEKSTGARLRMVPVRLTLTTAVASATSSQCEVMGG